jgi:hypothetical protein
MTLTAVTRDIRVRIASPGAPAVEGYVAVTLSLASLAEIPIVHGPIVDPLRGSSEMRPVVFRALDVSGALSAAFASAGRWSFVGRLCDVQANDDGAGWVTYGGGRLTTLEEDDGPGAYRLEISDESWVARRGGVFTGDNTTWLFPSTPSAAWRGWVRLLPARGRLLNTNNGGPGVAIAKVEITAGLEAGGQEVTAAFRRFAENDLVDNPNPTWSAVEGNFKTLRVNYDGESYPIVSFGATLPGFSNFLSTPREADKIQGLAEILTTLDEPTIKQVSLPTVGLDGAVTTFQSVPTPYGIGRLVTITAWIIVPRGTFPTGAGGPTYTDVPAYVHAPTAAPTAEAPLHIGIANAAHPWGTEFGGIHPATLTKRVWDALGVRYDAAAITALEADLSIPSLWLRVTATPGNVEAWMQDHVWAPCLLSAFVAANGERRLIDLRIPTNVDPFALVELNASNANAQSWRLAGREAITAIQWRYLNTERPFSGISEGDAAQVLGDGLIVDEKDWPLIEADSSATMGTRILALSLFGAMEPTRIVERTYPQVLFGGTVLQGAIAQISRDVFDLYRDGSVRGRIEVGRSTADQIDEGQLITIDQSSLKAPNPETGARTGLRVVRVLSVERHPAYGEVEYLDMGPSVQPLGPPSVALSQDGSDITVTVSGVAGGGAAVIDAAFTNDDDPPINWPLRAELTASGEVVFSNAPGSGWFHVRAKNTAPNRIRSPYVEDALELENQPRVLKAAVSLGLSSFGVPKVIGTLNAFALGVRIRAAVVPANEPEPDDLELADPSDFSAAAFTAGVDLEGIVGVPITQKNARLVVEVEPWSGFGSGTVSGTAGPVATASTPKVLFERPLAPTCEVKVLNTYVSETDDKGTGEEEADDWGTQGPQAPIAVPDNGADYDPQAPDVVDEVTTDLERPNIASRDYQVTVRDPAGSGGRLYIWTNRDSELNADPLAPPDAVIDIAATDPIVGAVVGPDDSYALSRVRIPASGYGTKRIYVRFDSDAGATSGFVPPFDNGARDNARTPTGRDRWDDLGKGGFDTGFSEKMALLEEMQRDFLAGFIGERYLTPDEIRDSEGLFTLMDGEGRVIENIVLESTVTDDGLREISLFLAKPSSGDPDDLDGVSDGATYRRVISVDSDGRVTVDSLAAGSVTAFAIDVGSLSEISDGMGILVSGQLIGTEVIIDLDAQSSEAVIEHDSFYLLANGDAGFAGELIAATGTFIGDVTIGGNAGVLGTIFLDNYGTIESDRIASPGIADITSLDFLLPGMSGAPAATIEMTSSANLLGGIYESYIDITATEVRLWGTVLVNGLPI